MGRAQARLECGTAELGPRWVELENQADAGAFAAVRAVAAEIQNDLATREHDGEDVETLRAFLRKLVEHGRSRAFEVGMEAVGRSFLGLYEAASVMHGGDAAGETPKRKRRGRRS